MNIEKGLGFLEKLLVIATFSTLLLAAVRSLRTPLTVDEGYNLEVVDNLARGVGYASYGNHRLDASWSAKPLIDRLANSETPALLTPEPWFFDPRVTTGPSVLVPLAVIWRLFPGNILLLRFFLWLFVPLFIATLWAAIPPGPRKGVLVALAASICCSLWFTFKAGAVLGEFPAVVYYTIGCVFLVRNRPFSAGVFFAFSVLSKVIMLFAVLGAASFLGFQLFSKKRVDLRSVILLCTGFLVPLTTVEVFRLVSLGSLEAYRTSWQEFIAFSREQTGVQAAKLLVPKWQSMKAMGPGLLFALAAVSALLLAVVQRGGGKEKLPNLASSNGTQHVGALLIWGAAPVLLLWVFRSAQTSYRQVLPASVLLFSGLMLLSYLHSPNSHSTETAPRPTIVLQLSTLLLVLLAVGSWARFLWQNGNLAWRYTLQLEAGQLLKASGAQGISPLVRFTEPFPFLSGLRVQPCLGPEQAMVVTAWAQVAEKKSREQFREFCEAVIAETPDALICWPKVTNVAPWSLKDLSLSDWGPKQLRVGEVPNPQPGGGGALWFRLVQPPPSKRLLALLLDSHTAGVVTWSSSSDWFSAPVDPTLFRQPRTYQVTLFDPCTGERKPVGELEVRP